MGARGFVCGKEKGKRGRLSDADTRFEWRRDVATNGGSRQSLDRVF